MFNRDVEKRCINQNCVPSCSKQVINKYPHITQRFNLLGIVSQEFFKPVQNVFSNF